MLWFLHTLLWKRWVFSIALCSLSLKIQLFCSLFLLLLDICQRDNLGLLEYQEFFRFQKISIFFRLVLRLIFIILELNRFSKQIQKFIHLGRHDKVKHISQATITRDWAYMRYLKRLLNVPGRHLPAASLGVSIVNFEHISHLLIVFLLLTLSR